MSEKFDYTRNARLFTAKYPMISYVSIQVNFWIFANILLSLIIYLHLLAISEYAPVNPGGSLKQNILSAILLGGIYGLIQGIMDYRLEQHFLKRKSLGRSLAYRTMASTLLSIAFFWLLYSLIRYVIAIAPTPDTVILNNKFWRYFFFIFFMFYFIMNLLLTFINQVNKKYGPGVLLPLLLGKYSKPIEEKRVFMFMDLKSSTTLAEELGHIQYSAFIRDSFIDINHELSHYNAEVYQYVGDEIVLTWTMQDAIHDCNALKFFFACEKRLQERSDYYMQEYNYRPEFKAGLHGGKVTAVEIGDIKRDIAYHGEPLNTASRIQSVCNEHKANFLASAYFLELAGFPEGVETTSLGMIQLKGKLNEIEIFSIKCMKAAV